MLKAWIESSTPSSSVLSWNGKTAPSSIAIATVLTNVRLPWHGTRWLIDLRSAGLLSLLGPMPVDGIELQFVRTTASKRLQILFPEIDEACLIHRVESACPGCWLRPVGPLTACCIPFQFVHRHGFHNSLHSKPMPEPRFSLDSCESSFDCCHILCRPYRHSSHARWPLPSSRATGGSSFCCGGVPQSVKPVCTAKRSDRCPA